MNLICLSMLTCYYSQLNVEQSDTLQLQTGKRGLLCRVLVSSDKHQEHGRP
jgi:hypothetical protein